MLTAGRRRALGAFYTPPDVARRLTDIALEGIDLHAVVCDPACGDGAFLVAAARALVERGGDPVVIARTQLFGADVDCAAVAAARAAVAEVCGADPGEHLVVADGLTLADRWRGRFDAVIGNPPFLNQLERATVRATALPDDLQRHAAPYTDTAWLFLVASLALVRDTGRVVLVQPQSLVAARDASGVRAAVTARLEGLWSCDERLFDASVRVCAPVLGRPTNARVRRWIGRDVRSAAPAPHPDASTWSTLLDSDAPSVVLAPDAGVLGDLADATAGFREQFYGLAPHVIDIREDSRPPLITSGLVDVGRVAWGERAARFAGTLYASPRVDVPALPAKLARGVQDRLRPKVVLATQTRVLEAAVDVDGSWVPSTPVISVEPVAPEDVWRVGAVMLAPPVSAWALANHAGAALAANAIKLSAKQARTMPLPVDDRAWRAGAVALRSGDIERCAAAMTAAYRASDEVLEWWNTRRWNNRR